MPLTPGQEYEVAVVLKGKDGNWGSPASVTPTTVTPEEFAPFPAPMVRNGIATRRAEGVQLTWEPVRHDSLEYYEVRRGPDAWVGAEIVGRTDCATLLVTDSGYDQEWYQIRARHKNGLYSPESLQVLVGQGFPAEYPTVLAFDFDGSPTWGGTHTHTEAAADGSLVLAPGKFKGIYETGPLDASVNGLYYWSASWASWEEEFSLVGEHDYTVGSGEARWRTVGSREATFYQPGADFDWLVGGGDERVGDEELRVVGRLGIVGAHTRCKAEMSFDDGGGFGSWRAFRNEPNTARKMKLRFLMDRRSDRYQIHLNPSILLEVFAPAPITAAMLPVGVEMTANKNQSLGYTGLDVNAQVESAQINYTAIQVFGP